jgi:hypothetical protein
LGGACHRAPAPQKIGVFADTNSGLLELTAYGEQAGRTTYTFRQITGVPNVQRINRFFVNMPDTKITNSKLYWLLDLPARVQETELPPLKIDIESVQGNMYSIVCSELEGKKGGVAVLKIGMPSGTPDRMYPVRLGAGLTSSVRENERTADVGTYPAANQANAVGSLRTINTACITYATTYNVGYPEALRNLGPPTAGSNPTPTMAGLVDEGLASGTRSGYTFTYRPARADSQGRRNTYTVVARPMIYGQTGRENYFTDQSGVIRFTSEDREATANDSPLAG